MAQLKSIERLLTDFQNQRPMRGGSLIITVFGDAISQHGGSVWLGSLIKALEPFGLNQRLVRTSVFRLIQENWLVSNQVGRKSYYSFTEFGLRQYQKTARRIYAGPQPEWDGQWTLVVPTLVGEEVRDELKKELRWLGYAPLATGLLARPAADRRSLDETLQELGVTDQVAVFNAHTEELSSQKVLKQLSHNSWGLEELEERYRDFLNRFRPVYKSISSAKSLEPEQCFQLRTLLAHDYRRILLKDSELPDELLPADWAGKAALTLAANIYRLVQEGSQEFLLASMETADGPLPKAARSFYDRFGGL